MIIGDAGEVIAPAEYDNMLKDIDREVAEMVTSDQN
jgi:hypothetical protein